MEGILTKKNILCKIFQYLDVKDLITASKVCKYFHTIIEHIINKNKYRDVGVCKTDEGYRISYKSELNNWDTRSHENQEILSENFLWEFLNLNTNNVQTLLLKTLGNDSTSKK